jgi:catechol 2,3-dioxygenase-like lactoylglutathione lyase family enzyme
MDMLPVEMVDAIDAARAADPDADVNAMPGDIRGVVQVTIPVSDLALSAAWYRDLLGLAYVREFLNAGTVTGCALADWSARYLIALRLRSDTPRHADLRGEHPVVLEAADAAAADRVRRRAAGLGVAWTGGVHADGHWTEYVDPDGIALRIVHSAAGPTSFLGVDRASDSRSAFYDTPRLRF